MNRSARRSSRKCPTKFHSHSETKHRHSPLIPNRRNKKLCASLKNAGIFLEAACNQRPFHRSFAEEKPARRENFETALLRRSEVLEIRHRLMTDHAGLSRRTGHRRNQGIRETMVAPGNHIKTCGGPVMKRQLAGTDFHSTGHRSRLT